MSLIHVFYKTTNNVTGKYYFGVHAAYKENDSYLGSGRDLKRDIKEYGKEAFTKEILLKSNDLYDVLHEERRIVTKELTSNPSCYNLRVGGCGFFGKNFNYRAAGYKHVDRDSRQLIGNNRTTAQQQQSMNHSLRMKNRSPWNKGKKGTARTEEHKNKMRRLHLGKPKRKVTCPKCGKIGGEGSMKRWHFDNCKE